MSVRGVVALERLRAGGRGRVVSLDAPDSPDAQRLLSLGFVPGAELSVEQRWPAFVVRVGEAVVAMEDNVAKGIHVRRAEE
ncbi:MAG: FeoA family protein [Elusimicrobiota bacterium]|jgi:ferrous iron transport protein A